MKRQLPVANPEPRHLPPTRAHCIGGARPCPYVSCRHHLYLDVRQKTGNIKFNFPELEEHESLGPLAMADSCALDIADRGPQTLEAVGDLLNLTRERCRQLEEKILIKLRDVPLARELAGRDDGPTE